MGKKNLNYNVLVKKQRNSNFELLRIISMLLIIMHHYVFHGGFDLVNIPLTSNKVFIQMLLIGGKLGVNLFILITGYFMINSKFKIRKLIKLLLQISFYSISIFLIFYKLGIFPINVNNILKSIFPVTFRMYWFASTYIILYILIPFLNAFCKSIAKIQLIRLIVVLIILWSIIPTFTTKSPGFSDLGWFITLYLISAFIRLYPNDYFNKVNLNIIVSIIAYGFVILSVIVFDLLGQKIQIFSDHATFFSSMNSLPILITSISLFLAFKNFKMGQKKIINQISMSMFGVYLIHDNQFLRVYIWNNLFKNAKYIDSKNLPFHALLVILFVFIVCVIIDQMRYYLIERPLFVFFDKKQENFKIFKSFCKRSFQNLISQFL